MLNVAVSPRSQSRKSMNTSQFHSHFEPVPVWIVRITGGVSPCAALTPGHRLHRILLAHERRRARLDPRALMDLLQHLLVERHVDDHPGRRIAAVRERDGAGDEMQVFRILRRRVDEQPREAARADPRRGCSPAAPCGPIHRRRSAWRWPRRRAPPRVLSPGCSRHTRHVGDRHSRIAFEMILVAPLQRRSHRAGVRAPPAPARRASPGLSRSRPPPPAR